MTVNHERLTDELPEYGAFAAALTRCGAPQSPAEAQGFALGMQIAGAASPLSRWQQELYSDFDPADVLAGECRALLDRLFATVFTPPGTETETFALLLPQDVVVDSQRLGALRDWCQGFLYGVGLGGDELSRRASVQLEELLHDIAEISRIDVDDVDNSRENQSAMIEIEEYLRVAVLLLRDEPRVRDRADDAE